MGIRLEVRNDYDPAALALQITQHMQNALVFKKQSEDFASQAIREEQRVKELQALLEECKK